MLKRIFGKRKLLTGLAVVTLTAGILAMTVGVVSAHGGGGWFGRDRAGGDALLAEELGITEEELQSARESARDKGMQQALEEGTITAEQYESYQVQQALRDYVDPQALMAQALGITVDELDTQSVSEWMDELGLDRETFQTQLQEARDTAIQQAVADGAITQEQADNLPDRALGGGRGRMPGMRDEMRGSRERAPRGAGDLEDSGFRGRGMIGEDQA